MKKLVSTKITTTMEVIGFWSYMDCDPEKNVNRIRKMDMNNKKDRKLVERMAYIKYNEKKRNKVEGNAEQDWLEAIKDAEAGKEIFTETVTSIVKSTDKLNREEQRSKNDNAYSLSTKNHLYGCDLNFT